MAHIKVKQKKKILNQRNDDDSRGIDFISRVFLYFNPINLTLYYIIPRQKKTLKTVCNVENHSLLIISLFLNNTLNPFLYWNSQ